MVTGIGLLSGGLDSMLAVRVLQEQGIRVEAISFVTPFFGAESAKKAAGVLHVGLHVIDFTEPHLEMLKNPKHGFGRNMNPCIDCHALMFRHAGRLMRQMGADFLFSGEVLGERPMSQNRQSLGIVARESGFEEDIIRPLSALLLPASRPERQGLVDRAKLMGLQGRSRKPQIELAQRYNLTSFPSPAGGCKLTDRGFSKRLQDLFEHTPAAAKRDLVLLSVGRHLRLSEGVKIIVGRNRLENEKIRSMAAPKDTLLWPADVPGPTVLVPGEIHDEQLDVAAAVCVRYSDVPAGVPAGVVVMRGGGADSLSACAAAHDCIESMMV